MFLFRDYFTVFMFREYFTMFLFREYFTMFLFREYFTMLLFREYFTGVLPEAHPEDARAAITLLGMCASSEVSIITSNIQVRNFYF